MTKITLASAIATLLVVGLATGADAAVRKHDAAYLESKPRNTSCAISEFVGPDNYCFIGAGASPESNRGRRVHTY
jgi:hypothetical protein